MENGAGLKKRFLALCVDSMMILAWGAILLSINLLVYLVVLGGVPAFSELGMNLISLTMIVPVFLSSTIMEAGKTHATAGKQRIKTKVMGVHSKTVTLWQAVVRNIVKFLPWQFAHMMIFRGLAFNGEPPPFWMAMLIVANILPLVWIAVVVFRKDHRGIHDLIAKTVVVDAGILSTI